MNQFDFDHARALRDVLGVSRDQDKFKSGLARSGPKAVREFEKSGL